MPSHLEVRDFLIRHADWSTDKKLLSNLRRLVFIVEQQVPQEEEWDGQDETAQHWLATDHRDHGIGTARLLPSGQIGRMAVLAEYRGSGVGAALLEAAVNHAQQLGFSAVFLNAQSHALGFYERAGFSRDGEEFMEAGIPHYRMTRQLTPLNVPHHRYKRGTESLDIALRQFDTIEASWQQDGKIIRKVRQQVLGRELQLPAEMINDDADDTCLHWHALGEEGQTLGAIRMDLEGNIARLAVLPECRHQGIGHALLEAAVARATRYGLAEARLAGLTTLAGLFTDAGFEPQGEPFMAHGLEHQTWQKDLQIDNVADQRQEQGKITGDDYNIDHHTYVLGADSQLLLLRREAEFQQVIVEMCQQARQSIRIWSPLLDHKLFHSDALRDCCSALARRNRYTSIEILIYDSHRLITNTHALLAISRKLPSSIRIKVVDPELRQLNNEFVLVDGEGVIYRPDHENYEGYANFRDITENNRLSRQFRAAWESGLLDPNIRQLKI